MGGGDSGCSPFLSPAVAIVTHALPCLPVWGRSFAAAEERKTGGAVGGDYLGGAAAKQPALSVDLGKDDTSRRGSEATAASPINSAGPHTTGRE